MTISYLDPGAVVNKYPLHWPSFFSCSKTIRVAEAAHHQPWAAISSEAWLFSSPGRATDTGVSSNVPQASQPGSSPKLRRRYSCLAAALPAWKLVVARHARKGVDASVLWLYRVMPPASVIDLHAWLSPHHDHIATAFRILVTDSSNHRIFRFEHGLGQIVHKPADPDGGGLLTWDGVGKVSAQTSADLDCSGAQ